MASSFTGPLLNADKKRGTREFFSKLPVGQETDYVTYFNDFLMAQDYATADWTQSQAEVGTGTATETLAADERSGALVLTNAANDTDFNEIQATEENYSLTSGKRLWYETKIKIGGTDITAVGAISGLYITDTTALAGATDSVRIEVADGAADILCKTEKNSTETSTDSGVDAVIDTYVTLGFYYDGAGSVEFYVNRNKVATHTTNLPDDENLCITAGVINGEAVVKTLTIDYIYVAQER